MVAKRELFPSNSSVAKRLKRVESKVSRAKPEIHYTDERITGTLVPNSANVVNILKVAQGTGVNQRTGNKIRVLGVEIRGFSAFNCSNHLIQSHTQNAVTYSDFNLGFQPFLTKEKTNTEFTEWLVAKGDETNQFRRTKKFKNGIFVKFNNSLSTPIDNGLYLASINNHSVSQGVDLNVRVWYYDA